MSKAKPADKGEKKKQEKPEKTPEEKARGTRETVESIIIAVILAFLFRAFEAEAFVIPTGSMAPTLQGRHCDIKCDKCGHRYRTGISDETRVLVGSTCPICRYTMPLDYFGKPNERPFNGDRILVNKFTYQLTEPKRWDVIVFKDPGNAKINFIKRLVGLPGERVRVQYGNVYVRKEGDAGMQIARKPPDKVLAMLQLVDDTSHLPTQLVAAGWPSRWQPWSPGHDPDAGPVKSGWQMSENGQEFQADGAGPADAWLRYSHIIPDYDDWERIEGNQPLPNLDQVGGQLITDFYAYNCSENQPRYVELTAEGGFREKVKRPDPASLGQHWVGDLAVECEAKVESESGDVLLELIKGGVHYQCRLNVADGTAALSIDGGFGEFQNEQGPANKFPTAPTAVKGPGKYRLRLANVDDQVFLWVNNRSVKFDAPTTYGPPRFAQPPNSTPAWSLQDPGDLAPAGVGTKGAALKLSNLRILRDVYYIAISKEAGSFDEYDTRFNSPPGVLTDPTTWENTELFKRRLAVEFPYRSQGQEFLSKDQFFPMGDNSPASSDARIWTNDGFPPPYVDRNLLIGKALFVYWPHTWNRPVPFTPNVQQMRFIR